MFHHSVKQLKRKVIVGLTVSSAVAFGLLGSCFERGPVVRQLAAAPADQSTIVDAANAGLNDAPMKVSSIG